MKSIAKYSKWVLASAMLVSSPLFTACSDDDDEPVVQVPENFEMNLASLNVSWNETEGVVDVAANDKWKAETTCPWITIDPSRGDAGDYRMFLDLEINPFSLPRTGSVTVSCGDKTGVVTVTQAGRPVELVAPVEVNLEVESLDYATGEISMANYENSIVGNLGMTLAEFGAGVEEDGNIEFFVVDKDGKWIEGGTAGTPCGAWFDSDLKVTNWDSAGYPANACFLEVYGGEQPTIVVGRAPGVPDDAEYTIKFGFTLKNDHSKYMIMELTVLFPKMELTGEIIDTIDIEANIAPNEEFIATPVQFDANAVAAVLGASSISLAKVVSYDANGDFIPYTANNGYWFDVNGNVTTWDSESLGWFIEYYGNDAEAEESDKNTWKIGPHPSAVSASGTSKIGFWYNAKVVMFNIKVTISE